VKRALAILALAFFALALQGAAARVAPPALCPNLALLLVLALGISLRNTAAGVGLAAGIGYLTDLLSGSLLGQHMLLRMLAFGAGRVGSRKLNLRGPAPLAVFAASLCAADAYGLYALALFFAGALSPPPPLPLEVAAQALVTGALAPLVANGVRRLSQALGDEEGARLMRLEPRKFPA
jgi:rod shape-determining protein MreD